MEQRVVTGDRAPDFDLLAVGSGRRVSLRGNDGRPVVLIFHLQGTAPTAREINRAVRGRYPSPDEVLVASVIDLSIVPPVYWMTVGLVALGQAYEKAATELPPDTDPAEYIVILPDWGGQVSRAYGVRQERAATIVTIDRDSNIASFYQGERPVETVFEILGRI